MSIFCAHSAKASPCRDKPGGGGRGAWFAVVQKYPSTGTSPAVGPQFANKTGMLHVRALSCTPVLIPGQIQAVCNTSIKIRIKIRMKIRINCNRNPATDYSTLTQGMHNESDD